MTKLKEEHFGDTNLQRKCFKTCLGFTVTEKVIKLKLKFSIARAYTRVFELNYDF